MAKMRSSHLVIGVAVVVMGYALMIIAMARQAERVAASAPAPTCAPVDALAPAPIPSSTDPRTTLPASTSTSMPSASATGASAASSAAPVAGADPQLDPQESRLFKFSQGGA